jgi:hypothetical protein
MPDRFHHRGTEDTENKTQGSLCGLGVSVVNRGQFGKTETG